MLYYNYYVPMQPPHGACYLCEITISYVYVEYGHMGTWEFDIFQIAWPNVSIILRMISLVYSQLK